MAVRLIRIYKARPIRQSCYRKATSMEIEPNTITAFGKLFKSMVTKGIVIDPVNRFRASRKEKSATQNIFDVFPINSITEQHFSQTNVRGKDA